MLRAITRALAQLFTGPIVAVLGACVMLSIGCFVALWFGIDWLLDQWLHETGQSTLITMLGTIATLVLTWFTFPLVASCFVALFLERVATLVERRHYPNLQPAKGLSITQSITVSVRFLLILVAANVLLLLLLFVPVAYGLAWFLVNGWLLGREYFELVAMRRMSPADANRLRKNHGPECLATGIALAFLLTLPVVNLVLPVLATAVMVHRYHDWQGHAGGG